MSRRGPRRFLLRARTRPRRRSEEKLGVARLVDGSVRKAGDVVRIVARLSRTDTGEQLWSDNFNRNLKDVFAVQTELAQTIVGQLSGQLTGGTADPAAKAEIQAQVGGGKRRNEKCRGA